ncbi:MAG: hypothetical protein ACOCYE_12625 [Pseudomonadota bacterium]
MNPWAFGLTVWRLQVEAATLVVGAPLVIGARVARAALLWSHPQGVLHPGWLDPDWQRMWSEKVAASAIAGRSLATAWTERGVFGPGLAERVMRPYGHRVRVNLRRLAR